jgi:hypothetical protein
MSNRTTIEPTIFQDLDSDLNPVGVSYYGFRIFDDYQMTYSTISETKEGMKTILNEQKGESHIKWIKTVMRYSDEISGSIFEYIREWEKGIYICNEWFDWDDIKEAFGEE